MEIIKINSVKARGLPQVVAQHRQIKNLTPLFIEVGAVQVYRGAFATVLDTVCWYAFGEKPNAAVEARAD